MFIVYLVYPVILFSSVLLCFSCDVSRGSHDCLCGNFLSQLKTNVLISFLDGFQFRKDITNGQENVFHNTTEAQEKELLQGQVREREKMFRT